MGPPAARPSAAAHDGQGPGAAASSPAGGQLFPHRLDWVDGSWVGPLLAPAEASALLGHLLTGVPWGDHSMRILGREVPMPRRIAWFGEHAIGYSGLVHPARPLPEALRALAERLEEATGQPYNGVLLNLYRDGDDAMGWHSDDDFDAGPHRGIASVSLGATRRFRVRARRGGGPSVGVDLEHGSLLWMPPGFQELHQHAVPRTRRAVGPRINLTYRWMAAPSG
ncbi:MAG: alpha-ketoglutarate-dependent dioxygenase AlkB [Planctomycetes bacterium]|nr:alpha-ketoglutarate-dependent dioxygenase AlkB [Planctomycetota bacterium]